MSNDLELYSYGVVKQVLASSPGLSEGMASLVDFCRGRHPHPAWDEVAALDFRADADAIHSWFIQQLPIPKSVRVLWFAPWDVVEGFDLRGSSSWSSDPEDWEWWYADDFASGRHASTVLRATLKIANNAEDFPETTFGELALWVVAIGYVSLAAVDVMSRVDPALLLQGRDELWAVSGFPDAVYGAILGRVSTAGFVWAEPRKGTARSA